MIIFPAIDIRQGRCVRLAQGRAEDETVYSQDPVSIALRWESEGAEWLHLVDLDGAMAVTSVNRSIARNIFRALKIPVQFGGGIRNMTDLDEILGSGAARAIIGTAAVRNPEFLAEAVNRYADQVAVGLDARNGSVATHGWNQVENVDAVTFAGELANLGVSRIIYTDIIKDGMLAGPSIDSTRRLAERSGLKIVASGGIASLNDLRRLRELEGSGVEGAVVGKALYERCFSLSDAIAAGKGS